VKRLLSKIGMLCAVGALLGAGAARADDTVTYSPFAANVWAGLGFDYFSSSPTPAVSTSNFNFATSFGADVGLRFTPSFAVVALGELAPIFGNINSTMLTLGGGLRFQPSGSGQYLLGGGFSSLNQGGITTNGWGLKAIGFEPIIMGFGPYLQLAYNNFNSTSVFGANVGISFSY
jgi:hypothetical protein